MKKILKFKTFFTLLLSFSLMLLPFNITSATAATNYKNSDETADNETIIDDTYINTEDSIETMSSELNNNYPIFLIHGLFGWGNNEVMGINYWGGTDSIRDMLNSEGYTVYTPTIGPISSNWDRACELYAYIVGGTVDYGQAHAEKYGHARYGRSYEGVYPQLSEINKIHLLGHSMGGQTARLLAQLLENGDEEEIKATGDETSPLFKGGQHFIESITTLATPHDGSQFDELTDKLEPSFHDLFAYLASITGSSTSKSGLDLQMDQWGLKQQEGESYNDYYKRVLQSKIWQNTTDLSIYDLSLEGAKDFNSKVSTQDDIYYFSIACVDTHRNLLTGFQVPNANMNPIMHDSSKVMGSYTQFLPNKVQVTRDWWRNDGIVSVRSAIAPHEGSTDTYRDYDGTALKGVWNYLGEIKNVDHIEVVGEFNPLSKNTLQNTFNNLAKFITSF